MRRKCDTPWLGVVLIWVAALSASLRSFQGAGWYLSAPKVGFTNTVTGDATRAALSGMPISY